MKSDGSCSRKDTGYPSDCEVTQGLRERAFPRRENDERSYVWRSCLAKAEPIVLFLLDVDGVLTDGTITYTQSGDESKSFNTRDGFGLRLVQEAGVEVGLITARTSEAVKRRGEDLSLAHVFQGVRKKLAVYERLKSEKKLHDNQIAYMGDDWLDLSLLSRVGLSASVADGVLEVRKMVDYVANNEGGKGAVREVCDLIIEAKGKTKGLLDTYLGRD